MKPVSQSPICILFVGGYMVGLSSFYLGSFMGSQQGLPLYRHYLKVLPGGPVDNLSVDSYIVYIYSVYMPAAIADPL
jgi:hypothetical protein